MITTTTALLTTFAFSKNVVSKATLLGSIDRITTILSYFLAKRSSVGNVVPDQPLHQRLEELNFSFKLSLVEALVGGLEQDCEHCPKALQIILSHLHQIFDRIHILLADIQR